MFKEMSVSLKKGVEREPVWLSRQCVSRSSRRSRCICSSFSTQPSKLYHLSRCGSPVDTTAAWRSYDRSHQSGRCELLQRDPRRKMAMQANRKHLTVWHAQILPFPWSECLLWSDLPG